MSVKTADVTEFWTGQKQINLLDQNLLACKDRLDLLGQLAETKANIDFLGGTDIRFLNDEIINAFGRCKIKDYHFAWDNPREDLKKQFKLFHDSPLFHRNATRVYVLVNYWSSLEEDLYRIYTLRSMEYMPYVMIYDKQKFVNQYGRIRKDAFNRFTGYQIRHFKQCQHMQRWCNDPRILKSVPRFEDYEPYKRWEEKGMPI